MNRSCSQEYVFGKKRECGILDVFIDERSVLAWSVFLYY